MKNLVNDFRGWERWEYAWLFAAVFAVSMAAWQLGGGWLAFVSSVTNIVCVILVAHGKITNYIWGMVGAVAYGIVSFQWGFYGESILNLAYYAPMQIIGFLFWRERLDQTASVVRRKLTFEQSVIALIVAALFSSGLSAVLTLMGGKLSELDAITTVLSVIAVIFMTMRLREQWILWITVNVLSIIMWTVALQEGSESAPAVLVMWWVFLVNSVYGYWKWGRLYNE